MAVHRRRRPAARHRVEGTTRRVPRVPPWVQTAVLTGWGLNKLTGGALGYRAELGKGLIKGVLGMTAGVVHIKAGTVRAGVAVRCRRAAEAKFRPSCRAPRKSFPLSVA